jgi:hypothetical protein
MWGRRCRWALLLALCAAAGITACSAGGSGAATSSAVSSSAVSSSAVSSSAVSSSAVSSSARASGVNGSGVGSSAALSSSGPPRPGTATTVNSLAAAPTPTSSAPQPSPAPTSTSSVSTAEPSPGTTEDTGFTSSVSEIDDALAARMGSSWHSGCPVPLADLRYLTVSYRGFDGSEHAGELVVAASVASDVVEVFHRLYDNGFPVRSMRLVDDFGGSDDDSMAADNSSAFNCRPVTGGGGFSEHSYGTAIDLNPVENPYLSGSLVLPTAGRTFVDRPDAPGVIHPGDAVVEAFASHGWTWGGTWSGPIDYQHFSVSGR